MPGELNKIYMHKLAKTCSASDKILCKQMGVAYANYFRVTYYVTSQITLPRDAT